MLTKACIILGIVALVISNTSKAGEPEITVEPVGLTEIDADALTQLVLSDPKLQRRLEGSRYRVLNREFDDNQPAKEDDAPSFRIHLYDYTRDRNLSVSGQLDRLDDLKIRDGKDKPAPTPEEMEEAIQILRSDSYFGSVADLWNPYDAMPGIIDEEKGRVVAVGLMPAGEGFSHEIVGVDLSRQRVIRYPMGAPPSTVAKPQVCAPPNAGQSVTGRGVAGQYRVTIARDGVTLWRFLVVRPSASSGRWGSAIDLREVDYKSTRVLSQLHVPIVNVLYDGNRCGPYRDWQYSENPFQATGTSLAPGILRASSRPTTILESGVDRGNYRGVAIWTEGTETVLMTEVQAGWYRYKSEFTFSENGTIRPRWGFSAVQDSCTCYAHNHHIYWRMDFDIAGHEAPNVIETWNGTSWVRATTEVKQRRSATVQRWRILNTATGRGFEITPGPEDGTADTYGKGDAWILRYMSGQIDDSRVYNGTSINIDRFLTGQSVVNTDVVFWYGGHFRHTQDTGGNHVIGPTIMPFGF